MSLLNAKNMLMLSLCLLAYPSILQADAWSLGAKAGFYVQGLEATYQVQENFFLVGTFDRKGLHDPEVESKSLGVRLTRSNFFADFGLSATNSYLYGPQERIEVERGYLGGRFGLGVFLPLNRFYVAFRILAADLFLIKETQDHSVFGVSARRSLPGRYGEFATLTFGYSFL